MDAHSQGDALVITYQAIEQKFARPGVRTAHFNAFVGLDNFKDVRTVFQIGRSLPAPGNIRNMALALTGRPVTHEDARVETRGVLMVDGSSASLMR